MSFRNIITDIGGKFRTGLDKNNGSGDPIIVTNTVENSSVKSFRKGLGKSSGEGAIADPLASLKTNLISYWNLEEDSGTRNDGFGTNHLTQIGTVDNKFNGANFNNNSSNRLAIASNSSLQINGSSFTVCCWVWLRSKTGYRGFVTKDNIGNGREFNLIYTQSEGAISDKIVFNIFNLNIGTGGVNLPANNFGSPPTEQWLFVVGQYDAGNNLLYVSVNNGTKNSASTTGITIGAGSADFTVGSWSGGVNGLTHDGGVKGVGFWKRLLTDDEIVLLYNNGLGRRYIGSNFV